MVQQLMAALKNLSAAMPRMLFVDEHGGSRVRDVSDDLFAEPLERARPVRDFFSWPGKRNYEGAWWCSTTHGLVRFESLLERQAITWFDFDESVVGLSSQPLALLWPRGTVGQSWHVPDLFLRHLDGTARVVDVRPLDRVDADAREQFSRTRDACAVVGWGYEVFTGLAEQVEANVRFLAGYRVDRCRPSDLEQAQLQEVFQSGRPLDEGIDVLTTRTGTSRAAALVHLYNLLWRHVLRLDLELPIRSNSMVTS